MTPRLGLKLGLVGLSLQMILAPPSVLAQADDVMARVSVATDGTQGNAHAEAPAISADGRYVAFYSAAGTLVPGDTNTVNDVFVHDRTTGTTTRVSVASDGTQGNFGSQYPTISADGRYVAFSSSATNLVAGDTNGRGDVFLHDRQTGTTTRVSIATGGAQGNYGSGSPAISADGQVIAFSSEATTLIPSGTSYADIYVHDVVSSTTTCVSVSTVGAAATGSSFRPAISSDGQVVVFDSLAENLVTGDTNSTWDVFAHDRGTGTTSRLSVTSGGAQTTGTATNASISGDGQRVLFQSDATDLVTGDTNGEEDAFVHDRATGETIRVSVATDGSQAQDGTIAWHISGDGRKIAFSSDASNLVSGDTFGYWDVFLHDLEAHTTIRISVDGDGNQAGGNSLATSLSYDGRFAAFTSYAANLVDGDTNDKQDIFVRDQTPPLSGWDYDLTVSDGPAGTQQLIADLAVGSDGTLATVWEDYRNGIYRKNGDIYAGVSTDGGATWSTGMRVNDDTSGAAGRRNPRVAVAPDGGVYVVWEDWRNDPDPMNPYASSGNDQNPDIYLAKLASGATAFGANVKVLNDADAQHDPDIAIHDDGTVYVAWYDRRGDISYGNSVVAKSTDGGVSFGNPVIADNHTPWALTPRLAANRATGTLYLVYQGHPNYYKPFFTRSTTGGATWSSDVQLDAGPDREWYDAARDIVVTADDAGHVFVIWADERNDPDNGYSGDPDYHDEFDIYANYSLNSGVTWLTSHNVMVNDDSTYSMIRYPSAAFMPDGTLVAMWRDSRTGDDSAQIWVATSGNYGATWSASTRVDHGPYGTNADRPALAISDLGTRYALWQDNREGDWDIDLTLLEDAVAGLGAECSGPVKIGTPTVCSATVTAGTGISMTWDLGANLTGTGHIVTHTYAAVGDYTVVVTATNALGAMTDTVQASVIPDNPPSAVTSLTASPDPTTPGDILLKWLAPDNDGGPAALYDIRTSSEPITDTNWDTATPVLGEPTPGSPWDDEIMTLNTPLGTRLYAALKSQDAGGQWSALSNVPSILDVGFRPKPDGYSFNNYGGANTADYTVADMIDMFGVDTICYATVSEYCFARPTAIIFNRAMNAELNDGHCEGMAVTSLRFFEGLDSVTTFDPAATETFSLTLPSVRRHVAWYSMLQVTDPVKAAKFAGRSQTPAQVLAALEAAMSGGADGPTILFVRNPGGGGHTVTPYALETRPDGNTWIRLYDNNDPGATNLELTVDPVADTWDYLGIYTGTAGSQTLGVVPIQTYTQQPTCPWCSNASSMQRSYLNAGPDTSMTLTSGDAHLLFTDTQGRRIGYDADTFVNEIPGAYATDVYAGFGVRTEPLYSLPLTETYTMQVSGLAAAARHDLTTAVPLSVTQIGPGFAVAVSGLGTGSTADTVSIGATGSSVAVAAGAAALSSVTLARDIGTAGSACEIAGLTLGAGSTITVALDAETGSAHGDLCLDNSVGSATAYTLTLTTVDDGGEATTSHEDITFAAGATHVVDTAAWEQTGGLTVEIDTDGDGEADDTIVLSEPDSWTIYLPLVLR